MLTVLGGLASLAGIVALTVEVGRLAVDADLAFHRSSGRAARAAR